MKKVFYLAASLCVVHGLSGMETSDMPSLEEVNQKMCGTGVNFQVLLSVLNMNAAAESSDNESLDRPKKPEISYEADRLAYINARCSLESCRDDAMKKSLAELYKLNRQFSREHGLENVEEEFIKSSCAFLREVADQSAENHGFEFNPDYTQKMSEYLELERKIRDELNDPYWSGNYYSRKCTKFKQKKYEKFMQARHPPGSSTKPAIKGKK